MKDWRIWAVLAGLAGMVWWWSRKNMPPPTGAVSTDGASIDIASLKTATGEGLDAQQSLDIFQGLFGILNASDKLDQLRNTIVQEQWVGAAHSTNFGGWATTKLSGTAPYAGGTDIGAPLAGPDYLLKRLGVGYLTTSRNGTVWSNA
jgi:hypothetical protein